MGQCDFPIGKPLGKRRQHRRRSVVTAPQAARKDHGLRGTDLEYPSG